MVGTVWLSSQNLIEFSSSVFFRLCVFVFVCVKGEKKVAEIIQYVHDLSLICLVSSRLSRICCQAVFVMSVAFFFTCTQTDPHAVLYCHDEFARLIKMIT